MPGRAQAPGGKTWANLMLGAWADLGACIGHNAEWWFPAEPSRSGRRRAVYGPDADRAIKICQTCPVVQECLAHALEHDERFGVWGGTLPQQRDHGPVRSLPMSPMDHGTEAGAKAHQRRGEDPCPRCQSAAALAARERKARRKAVR